MIAEHTERLRLRHRPDDLFDLVADVRSYPKFIELITAMRVTREDLEEGSGTLDAEARVRFRLVRESFSTRVKFDRPRRVIEVSYLAGPFHELENRWTFHELSDGSTLVDFWIHYGFKNPILQVLLDANRSRAIRFLVHSFENEAKRRYEEIGDEEIDLDAELQRLEGVG
jgi:coenzyme Q-binding protein COQ10